MICADPNRKEKTLNECVESLECLLKNSKGSDYNYQLTVSDSPFNIIKKRLSFLTKGVWHRTVSCVTKEYDEPTFIKPERLSIKKDCLLVCYWDELDEANIAYELKYADYGKTWAATKEELPNVQLNPYHVNDKIIITIDGSEFEAIIDSINEDKIECHIPPKHRGRVYTARIWEFPLNEYGRSWRKA